MPLAAWLLALVPALVGKILGLIGVILITMIGVDAAFAALRSQLFASFIGWPADLISLISIVGIGKGISIVCGAWAGRIAIWVYSKSISYVWPAPGGSGSTRA